MPIRSIPDEEDSIYNIIPQDPDEIAKPKRYQSKSHGIVKEEMRDKKAQSKSMGPAKVKLNEPTEFLKKREKEPVLPQKQQFFYSDGKNRPPVPSIGDAPVMGLKSNKNFIHQNAVETIMAAPKMPDHNVVDTRKGHTFKLDPSGLQPVYTKKKEFGQTPQYLQKRKEEEQKAQEDYDAYVQEQMQRGRMHALTEEEKKKVLNGLKVNWAKHHDLYQKLPLQCDTPSKNHRKEKLEAAMKQLEDDIEMLEKYSTVYIAS